MTKGDLVAEGVGERFDRVVGGDAVAGEVEGGVQRGELEGPGPGEHPERSAAQPPAA
jgi:hypothetical protein